MKGVLFLILFFTPYVFNQVRSQEKCFYSSTKEYSKCISENANAIREINYPIEIGNNFKYQLWQYKSSPTRYLQFKFTNSGEILIKGRTKLLPFIFSKFKGEKFLEINSNDIFFWDKKSLSSSHATGYSTYYDSYEIRYLDKFGKKKKLIFQRSLWGVKGDIFSEIFQSVSNINGGQNNLKEVLNRKLKYLEKQENVIRSVLIISYEKNKNCINLNKEKYPELFQTYRNILSSINPIREELGLSEYSEVGRICTEI